MPMNGEDYLVLRRFASEAQANLVKNILEGSGIEVFVHRDDCCGWEPFAASMNSVRLIIKRSNQARAEELLKEIDLPKEKRAP